GTLHDAVVERREQPNDDIISFVANMKVDGRPIPMEDVLGVLELLLIGGVETTASLLGSALMHLHADRKAREWLQDDLSRLPVACEEYLRYFAPVTGLARTVTSRCQLEGQTLEEDDRIWLSWAGANRDPS